MKQLNAAVSVLALSFVIVLSGCSKGSDNAVLAKVNRSTITAADFKKQLEDLNPQLQQAVAVDPNARKEFLENLILSELLIQEAKRQGLDKEAEFKKNQEKYKKDLERQIQEQTKRALISSVLEKALGDKLKNMTMPTDKEVRDYYNKNKKRITAVFGKQVSLKDIEPRIKNVLIQEKQSKLSLEYAQGLKAKASISVDDKALAAAVADLSRPTEIPGGLTVQKAPAPKAETKK